VREVTCYYFSNRPYYSYGDSSGIEPDSLLTPIIYRGPFTAANVKSIKPKFKKGFLDADRDGRFFINLAIFHNRSGYENEGGVTYKNNSTAMASVNNFPSSVRMILLFLIK
jgi:hypothetical protein